MFFHMWPMLDHQGQVVWPENAATQMPWLQDPTEGFIAHFGEGC
jgi:hypothetical protein